MDGANFSINSAGCTEIDLQHFVPDPLAVSKLDLHVAKQCSALPISYDRQRNRLVLATKLIKDVVVTERLIHSISHSCNLVIEPLRCESIDVAINQCYGAGLSFSDAALELKASQNAKPNDKQYLDSAHPLIRLVNSVLHAAVDRRASDIHINPAIGSQCRIRFRVDGVLSIWQLLDVTHLDAVTVRIKLLAALDISESRLPQDGQFKLQIQGRWVDFRVSTFPTTKGENLVLRVLDKRSRKLSINDLVTNKAQQSQLKSVCEMKDGLVIVCGPTGCGKSTTLLAMLSELDSQSLNIMTLEDPVENGVKGIQQCSIRSAQNFDYADGVRALLRQDPDVLLIGEIRDSASAAMAFRAALTGHGVLTTIHCRDTRSAILRLNDLGIGSSGVASCVNVIIAQRLIRKLCAHCANKHNVNKTCSSCSDTGYYGRLAVLEVMQITDAINHLLCDQSSPADIWRCAVESGMQTLRFQIESMISKGITDQAELHRVIGAV